MVCAKLCHSVGVAERVYAIAGQDVPAIRQALALEDVSYMLVSGRIIKDIKIIKGVSYFLYVFNIAHVHIGRGG